MKMRIVSKLLLLPLLLAFAMPLQAENKGPDAVVKETSEAMLAELKKNKAMLQKQPEKIYDLVNKIVIPHFDFVRISQWVLGKNWRVATPQQRGAFVNEFRLMLVNTYATALLEYSDQTLNYIPLRMPEGARTVIVRTEVVQAGAAPTAINYRMFNGKQGWKVFDVLVDGVSLVANYRTSFASEIQQTSIDALIKRLSDHNIKKGSKSG